MDSTVVAWMLPLFILLVWLLWALACACQSALNGAQRGIPPEQRPGTSVLPGVPLFPLVFWGIALAINAIAQPWGTYIVGAFHALFGLLLVVFLLRDSAKIRRIDGRA